MFFRVTKERRSLNAAALPRMNLVYQGAAPLAETPDAQALAVVTVDQAEPIVPALDAADMMPMEMLVVHVVRVQIIRVGYATRLRIHTIKM